MLEVAPPSPEPGLQTENAGSPARLSPLLSKKRAKRTTPHKAQACRKLEQQVGAVAVRRIAGVLAAAQQRRFVALGGERQRLYARAFMRAVAKGLLLASPAAAPSVTSPGFQLDLIRAELRSFRL